MPDTIDVLDANRALKTIKTNDALISVVATAALQITGNSTLVEILAALAAAATNLQPTNLQQVGGIDVDPNEPAPTTPAPTTTWTHGEVALSTTVAQIRPSNTSRRRCEMKADVDWYVGKDDTVATSGAGAGYLVYAGEKYDTKGHVGSVWAILAEGTGTASFSEHAD